MSILKKSNYLLFTVLSILTLFSIFTIYSLYSQEVNLKEINRNLELTEYDYFPLNEEIHRMDKSVIQVQQWIQDIASTRGQDGLNDGFDMAEEFANLFSSSRLKAIEMTKKLELNSIEKKLSEIEKPFAEFYAVGK